MDLLSTIANRRHVRIGLVMSAGGLRGAAHVGVLRALAGHGVDIDVMVGVSAGAVIAAYYAAVGLETEDLLADAHAFRGRHLLTYSLAFRLGGRLERLLGTRCGIIPERLRQLERAGFDHLHHGVRALGIVCHDTASRRPRYFATGLDYGASLAEVVRASAAIPFLFPPHPIVCQDENWLLTDGGISDPVPLSFARRPPLGATHVIVSDCRTIGRPAEAGRDLVWIRPRMRGTGTLWAPYEGLLAAVRAGEAAVTPDVLATIREWRMRGSDRTR
jgi:NTE family protein